MQEFDYKKDRESDGGDEVYSQSVRAGKRTYFFDVKATKNDDYYLTITESRKKQISEGNFSFEKHKIFLYKEDFDKFASGLCNVVNFIKEHKPEFFKNLKCEGNEVPEQVKDTKSEIDIEFDSL